MTTALASKAEKLIRADGIAASMGIRIDQLKQARRLVAEAEMNVGASKGKKAEFIARRLSITPLDLKELRAGLNGTTTSLRSKTLVHQVLRLESPKAPEDHRNASVTKARAANPGSLRGTLPTDRAWTLSTHVFVTDFGDAVHCFNDCTGLRGFRHAHEPDPIVHQVELHDPTCIGRRACRKCLGSLWSPAGLDALDRQIEQLHGSLIRLATPKHSRRLDQPSPIIHRTRAAKRTRPQKAPSSQLERLRQEADRLGISLQEAAGLGRFGAATNIPMIRVPRPLAASPPIRQPGGRMPSAPPRPAPLTAKEGKAARDRTASRALGISVEQLKERRRAEAAANHQLNAEANSLGITARELRHQRNLHRGWRQPVASPAARR